MSYLWIDQNKIPEFSHTVITVFMSHIRIPVGDVFRCGQLKYFFYKVLPISAAFSSGNFFNTLPKKAKITLKQTLLWAEPNHMIMKSAARTPDTQ